MCRPLTKHFTIFPMHTLVKSGSPSLTRGREGYTLAGFITRVPFFMSNRLDITSKRSEVFFTGRNRLLGTLMP